MARPRKTAEERAEQRKLFQQAARDLYREGGRSAVTARAIAERAGQSTGTLYAYFDDLSALLRSLWNKPVLAGGRQLEALLADIDDPVEQIRLVLKSYVSFARADQDLTRTALLFVRAPNKERPEPLPLTDLPFHQLLVGALAEGIESGVLRDNEPELLAQVLWAGVHGVIALPVNADAYDVDQSSAPAKLMIELLLRSILADATTLSV